MVEQYTSGEDGSIGAAASTEIQTLVANNAVTVDHAITALSSIAAEAPTYSQLYLSNQIFTLADQHQLTPAQIATDVAGGGSHAISFECSCIA